MLRVFQAQAHAPARGPTKLDFDELFRRHYSAIVRVMSALGVRSDAVEDLAQEVFVVAHRKLEPDVDPDRARLSLYGIARRLAANHRRGQRRRDERHRRLGPPSAPLSPEEAVTRKWAAQLLEEFLEQLPDEQRDVFVLAEIEGCKAPEVAELLEVSTTTVHARLRLARAKYKRLTVRLRARTRGTGT